MMGNKKGLTNKQKLITGTVTSLGMVAVYTGGVTLAKFNPIHHDPIFLGTVVVSFISPYLFNTSTTYLLKKYNEKKNKQLKK